MKKNIIIVLSCFVLMGIVACEREDALQDRGVPASGPAVKAMHMSPDAPSFNIYVDSTRTVTLLSTTGVETGLAFGGIAPSLSGSYAYIQAGTHTLSARVPTSSTVMPGQTITSKSFNFVDGKFYTVAIVDSLSRLDAVIVEDNLSVGDTSKAYFRIANFIPNASADVDFTSTTIIGYNFQRNAIPFKTVTNFDTIAPATYKILLRANGSSTRLDSINAFTPAKGRKYTLYTRGVLGQTGSTNTKRPLIFSTTTF